MIEFVPGREVRNVLLIGAHSDDIEIGAGGTVLKLLREREGVEVNWVVLAAQGTRSEEAFTSAERFLKNAAGADIRLEAFRERYFPYQAEIKEYFDQLGADLDPDVVICPWSHDAHQDHRTAAELTLNTFRDHAILQYEVVKVDGDLGRPNLYVELPTRVAEEKIDLLLEMFPSQRSRSWFDADVFRGILRIRGVEAGARSGFAEAFHSSRSVISI